MINRIRSIHVVVAGAALAAAPAIAAAQDDPGREPQGQQEGSPRGGQQQAQPGASERFTKKINVSERFSMPAANGCEYTANINGTVTPARATKGSQKGGGRQGGGQQGSGQQGGSQGTYQQQSYSPQAGGAQGGAQPGGAQPGGAQPGGAQPGGAQPGGAQPGGSQDGRQQGSSQQGGAQGGAQQRGGRQPGGAQQGGAQHLEPNLTVNATLSCPGQPARSITDSVARTGPMTPDQLEQTLSRRATIVTDEAGRQCAYMPEFQLSSQRLSAVGLAHLCVTEQGPGGQRGQGSQGGR